MFTWVTHKRTLAELETILWLLIVSFALLAPAAMIWHEVKATYPTLGTILKDPQSVPLRIVASLYAIALPAGWIVGRLDRARIFEKAFIPLGIDLRRRHDVWYLAFRDSWWVIVYLEDGVKLYGWPAMTTTNRDGNAAEVLLEKPFVWSKKQHAWREKPDITGIWLDCSKIQRIEFTRPKQLSKTPAGGAPAP
jgi:hypothetical protein